MKKLILFVWLISLLMMVNAQNNKQHPNVLFIAVDDMADWVGYLKGHPDVKTPNIDRLSNRGIAFTNAYCTSPVCGPSRAAIMTGLRPETSGAYHNLGDYRDFVPNAISLPEYFRRNGYYTAGAGKLIHPYNNVVPEAFDTFGPGVGIVGTPFTDEELATSNMPAEISLGENREPARLPFNDLSTIDRPANRWSTFDWGPLDIRDDEMPDGQIANWGVEQLQKDYDKPFFLGVGFYKPHQPLFAPKKYFEMYNIDENKLTGHLEKSNIQSNGPHFFTLPLAKAEELLFEAVKANMERYMLKNFKNRIKLLPSILCADENSLLGASGLIWQVRDPG